MGSMIRSMIRCCRMIGNGITCLQHLLLPFAQFVLTFIFSLVLQRSYLAQNSRLRFGHYRLPAHSFYLSLNDSPYCTRNEDLIACNASYLLFNIVLKIFIKLYLLLSTICFTNNVLCISVQSIDNIQMV